MPVVIDEITIGVIIWIVLIFLGLEYRRSGLLIFATAVGYVEALFMLTSGWSLLGFSFILINLYLTYVGITSVQG